MIVVTNVSVVSSSGGTMVCITVQGLAPNVSAELTIKTLTLRPSTVRTVGGITTLCFKIPPGVHGNAFISFGDLADADLIDVDV